MTQSTNVNPEWFRPPRAFISHTLDKPTIEYSDFIGNHLRERGIIVVDCMNNFPYDHKSDVAAARQSVSIVSTVDLFIMIVGKKLGSLNDDGRSWTQCEYDHACSLGLPRYVYIHTATMAEFNRLCKEPATLKRKIIQSDEHFQFIHELSETCVLWSFKHPQECTNHLDMQFRNYITAYTKLANLTSPWLWNDDFTKEIEKNATEVWVVTPDFYWDFQDNMFRNVVEDNLSSGKTYRYIYPTTAENDRKAKAIKLANENTEFLAVPEEDFFWCCEQVIYDPFKKSEQAIMVGVMEARGGDKLFDIELGRSQRMAFRTQFIRFWNERIVKNNSLTRINY